VSYIIVAGVIIGSTARNFAISLASLLASVRLISQICLV
jgi:hypothetical protein